MSRIKFILILTGAILIAGVSFGFAEQKQGAPKEAPAGPAAPKLSVTIDASKIGEPISPYIYGQFLELLGTTINTSLWAEMIDDRKFFYPVNSAEKVLPENTRRWNRWRPVGPDESVVMDKQGAYVGEHSPAVRLEGETPRGIRQAGLVLRNDRVYAGRVVLAGSPSALVRISLVWGPGPADRETVEVEKLTPEYLKYPIKFTSKADSDDGALEITGQGQGVLRIGAVSLMPADNIQGMRRDSIQLLKELRQTIYRWPGGNFLSGYEWRNGIGDPDERPQTYDYAWRAVEPNDFGLDEFIAFCRLIDTEPYIAVNSGFGDAHSAAEEVEYANGSSETPMGRWRAANGHPEPYNVKWWSIGNEMYGAWQLGYMSLNHYVIKHNLFAKAMRAVDPTIKLFATGAAPDETTATNTSRRVTGKIVTEPFGPADWSYGLLLNCADSMDFLSEHFYVYSGQRLDNNTGRQLNVNESLADFCRRIPNRVRCKVEAWWDYLAKIPSLKDTKIRIAIDEWNYGNLRPFSLKGALSVAEGLHEMFRYTDIITMAAYTMGTSNLAYNKAEAVLQTNGLVFKLYRHHFGTLPVAVLGNSPQQRVEGEIGGVQPRVTSGSDTYPVDIASALSADKKTLTVAIVNPNETAQEMTLAIQGVNPSGKVRMWRLTGPNKDAFNEPGKKLAVDIVEVPVKKMMPKVSIPAVSIDLYELAIK